MSSLFDSFFGFIFWGVAYFRMRQADGGFLLLNQRSIWGFVLAGFNIVIILIGFFFLTLGTYASVDGIVQEFHSGNVGKVFACSSSGL